jgi:hypothetical protein
MIYRLSAPLEYKCFSSYEEAAIAALVYLFALIEYNIKHYGYSSEQCLNFATALQLTTDKRYKEALDLINQTIGFHMRIYGTISQTEADNIQNNFKLMTPLNNDTMKYINDKIKIEVFK